MQNKKANERDVAGKPSKPKPKERDIQRSILDFLRAKGIFAERRNVGAARFLGRSGKEQLVRFSSRGAADIYGCLPPSGRHFEIEAKNPGWKPPENYHTRTGKVNKAYLHWQEQLAFGMAVRKSGGIWFVAVGLGQVRTELGL